MRLTDLNTFFRSLFALSLHITLPVLLLVVFPLFRSSDILIAMCFLFLFFFLHLQSIEDVLHTREP